MKSSATDEPRAPGQAPIKTRRFGISLVWIVPIVAVLVGISLVVHNVMQEGPTIVLTFKTGSGLTANKTEVKYRNVVIGHVTGVELSDDQKTSTPRSNWPSRPKPSPAKTRNSGWCAHGSALAGFQASTRCSPATTSAPTSASPTTAPNTSRA